MSIEIQILNAIQSIRSPLLDVLMPAISNGLFVWFVLAAFLLMRKNTRQAGWMILTAIGLEVILCNLVMKNAFQRIRPCDVNPSVALLISRPTDYSFPSGHTGLSFAAATAFWRSGIYKRWRIPALVFACLIAFSRLYLYVHYPSDILMGILVGVFCSWTASRIFQHYAVRKQLQEVSA